MTPDEAFAWVRRRVEWSAQGWLAYVFTDDAEAADTLRAQLELWFAAQDLPFEALRPARPDELASLGPRLAQLPGSIWLEALFETRRWETAWVDCLLRLNSQRDTMLDVHRMVLFVAPASMKDRVRAAGPDLWAKHARIIDLGRTTRSLTTVVEPSTHRLGFRDLDRLIGAAAHAGLADLRTVLMRGIPERLSQSLIVDFAPADQLFHDLTGLSALVVDDEPALLVWLRNAAPLVRHEPDIAAIFQAAAEHLKDDSVNPASTPEFDAFLIYGGVDSEAASRLTRALESRDLHAFFDRHAFEGGTDWTRASLKVQARSKTSIWIVGEESTLRGTTSLLDRPEVAAAVDRERSDPGSLIAIHPDAFSARAAEFMLPKTAFSLNLAELGWDGVVDAIEAHLKSR